MNFNCIRGGKQKMLRHWLTVFLVACSLVAQGAWLTHSHPGTSAEGISAFSVICDTKGDIEQGAPAHDASPKNHCSACILCGADILALGALFLALISGVERQDRLVPIVRQRLKSTAYRALRPPSRAPPVFS